ncbi:hypothetical protein [Streptomyces sp. NPDC001635]
MADVAEHVAGEDADPVKAETAETEAVQAEAGPVGSDGEAFAVVLDEEGGQGGARCVSRWWWCGR